MASNLARMSVAGAVVTVACLTPAGDLVQFAQAAESASEIALDQQKLAVAKKLTDWLQESLRERKAIAAVVSRKGGKDVKGRDRTGMAHSAIAIYDPRAQTWILYQILGMTASGQPVAQLWRMAPIDFFYGQTGYDANALLMIPDVETQQRVYESILNGKAFQLAFTKKYNLLSEYDSPNSLNCNKWILMTIAAARSDDYSPENVLNIIHNGFEPGTIHMNFIEKAVAKRKKNVRRDEVPNFRPVQTVTPQSLYDSGLFKERLFAGPIPF